MESRRFPVLATIVAFCAVPAFTQPPAAATSQLAARAFPSVVSVIAGRLPAGSPARLGGGIIVRENGVILTTLDLVKDATSVQIRFRNGETFDGVQLLGIDKRRNIAAIKITAAGLPLVPIAAASGVNPGDPITTVTSAGTLPWSTSTGVVSEFRTSDQVPGAEAGYRILQFTAPVPPGGSGGLVMNAKGEALGIIVGTLSNSQNVNFAVPLESVTGLADLPAQRTFGNGSGLSPAVPNRASLSDQATPGAPEKSDALANSKDPDFLRRNFKTMYVEARRAQYFGSDQMKAALGRNKDFASLNIRIVDDQHLADVVLDVGYTFAWDFPFELKHQNTRRRCWYRARGWDHFQVQRERRA